MNTASRNLHTSANGHEFAEKLTELRELLADIARSAPAAASETFEDLKAKAAAVCESCENGISDATHKVVRTVKDHPAQVAIAAIGAGLLAWWLLSRGRHGGNGE
jgi:ElaB/YqjD/DUF883 family membrane-anchored ribosome-binding protein